MVRFIIRVVSIQSVRHGIIYIPIWLDLLLKNIQDKKIAKLYLHSNMVRFIMEE